MDLAAVQRDLDAYVDWYRGQIAKGPIVMWCRQCAGEMHITNQKHRPDGTTYWLEFTCRKCGRIVEA